MTNHLRPTVAALAIAAATLSWSLTTTADDGPTVGSPAAPGDAAPATPPITYPPYRRVPNNYGKIGLSAQQREDIYVIRGRYRAEVAELERRIEALSDDEMEECSAVLTDSQRSLLEQLRKASGRSTRD